MKHHPTISVAGLMDGESPFLDITVRCTCGFNVAEHRFDARSFKGDSGDTAWWDADAFQRHVEAEGDRDILGQRESWQLARWDREAR